MKIHAYPQVFALGHPAISELLLDPVVVEEKVDGSQFSFARINGEVHLRSKGAEVFPDNPEGMFALAVKYVRSIEASLKDGWVYRAEYLNRPKHNALPYERVPQNNLMLFDIELSPNEFVIDLAQKEKEALRLGIECVPAVHFGAVSGAHNIEAFLERESVLGGTPVEGIVVKNYSRFGRDKKILVGKFVSERFKEVLSKEWKKANPAGSDIIDQLVATHRTEARWLKSIQHKRDAGELEHSPRDIGNLLKEIGIDTRAECEEEIKEFLFKWAWPKVSRGISRGFPEFYKTHLMKQQFEVEESQPEVQQ